MEDKLVKENKESEFSRMKKVIMSCVAGSALEWYDFAVYSFFAVTIGKLFFPGGDEFQQTIASFGAFASGLIARPIGAILFGYIGDIYGRKKTLVISIYMMAIPTALMGFLPTYESIGIWAGILLTIVRIVQGLALGGGFTATIVFLYEHSSASKKATYSSWAPFSLVSGFILGAIVANIMFMILDAQQLETIGWRIPFIISFVGTFIAEYMKHRLEDPTEFIAQQNEKKDENEKKDLLRNLFRNHWKGVTLITVTDVLTACGYFLIAVFFTSYFEQIIKLPAESVIRIQTVCMIFLGLSILLGGWLADHLGKRIQMLVACCSLAALAFPLFGYMQDATATSAMLGEMGIIFLFAMYYGPIPATICSMLPTKVRLIGVSIAHNLAMAAFGAYASSLALYLVKWTGDPTMPAILFVISALVTAVALFIWKEGKEY